MLKFSNAFRVPFAPGLLALASCVFPAIGFSCPAFSSASPYFGPVTLTPDAALTIGAQAATTKSGSNTTFSFFSVNGTLLGSQTVATNCFDSQVPGTAHPVTQGLTASGVGSASMVSADFNGDGTADVAVSDGISNILVYLSQNGALQFAATYPAGNGPVNLVAADVNGDGILDLVVANFGSGSVSVLLGVHGGSFQNAVTYATGGHPGTVAVGDVNSDGFPDIVAGVCASTTCGGTSAAPGRIAVLAGKGDGTFSAASTVKSGVFPLSLVVADFSGDGNLDVAFGDAALNAVTVLAGNGSGAFPTSTSFPAGSEPDYLGFGDFNNDGILDLAVLNTGGGTVSILYGQGSGLLGPPVAYAAANGPTKFAIADFNGDSRFDIALQDMNTGNLEFLFNAGGTAFLAPRAYIANPGPAIAAAGDFNGDGHADFVLGSRQSESLLLFLGAGGGAFYASLNVDLPSGATPTAIAAADFDKDGKQDLLIGTTQGLYLAKGSDNGFGVPQEASLSGGIATASPFGIVVADFNGDGVPDFATLSGSTTGGATVSVYTGNGDGSFTSAFTSNYTSVISSTAIGAPDLNGDGKADLVVLDAGGYNPSTAANQAGAINVLLNTSSGTAFADPVLYSASTSPYLITYADFNKDGKLDIAVVTFDGQGDPSVALLTGDGAGKLNAATFTAIDRTPQSMASTDFNGDGSPDIVVSTVAGLNVLINDGAGGFHTPAQLPAGPTPQGVAVADFNGDGNPDLAVAASGTASSTGYAVVLLNRSSASGATLATVNGASFAAGPVAPLSIVSSFGSGLAAQPVLASSLATTLGGVTISIIDSAGATRAANIFYVSPGQVNYEIPEGTAAGIARVVIQKSGTTAATGFVEISAVSPGLFSANGRLAAGSVVHVDSSNQQTPGDIVQCDSGACTAVPIDVSASAGKAFLILYGTGIRGAALSDITVQAGNTVIKPGFASGQGTFAGLDQVNLQLPASLAGSGDIAITVTAAGVASNAVHVTIQ
jgi:uncharacterized protein (TIGR03437 family)